LPKKIPKKKVLNKSNMEFPLKRNDQITFQEIYNVFHTMKNQHRTSYTPHNITGQELKHFYGLIILENKTIVRLQKLTDYFQEQHRITAKRYDQELTPLEYWQNNKELTRNQVRRQTKECTNFCPTIICSLIKLFKSKHILDFSSGWGDRLLGVMTYDDKIKSYYGIDPNKSLHTGYKNMIKSFLPKSSKQKYNMINDCAEVAIKNIDQNFDLIFTSPPYFDLEKYSDSPNQSINKFPRFEDWYNKFLLKSSFDSINKLVKNGIFALNINDTKDHKIVDRLIKDLSKISSIEFLGIIYFGNPAQKSYIYQPILVWLKK